MEEWKFNDFVRVKFSDCTGIIVGKAVYMWGEIKFGIQPSNGDPTDLVWVPPSLLMSWTSTESE